jgi:hypothetical protein
MKAGSIVGRLARLIGEQRASAVRQRVRKAAMLGRHEEEEKGEGKNGLVGRLGRSAHWACSGRKAPLASWVEKNALPFRYEFRN